jgi:uncharacterized protein YdhG (YjbR/CyaY superfamily)
MAEPSKTVQDYLNALPADRRAAIETVRTVILANLDRDYEEGIQYGMLGYYVPHRVYPAGYHCDPKQPLPFAALASQKNYMSLYLMSVYGDEAGARAFRQAWEKTGKKLDMGKVCIRFTNAEQVALDVVGDTIRRIPARRWIEIYEASRTDAATRTKVARKDPPSKSKAPAKAKPAAAAKKAAAPRKAAGKAAAKPAARTAVKKRAAR